MIDARLIDKLENYAYNLMLFGLGTWVLAWLRPHVELIDIYFNAPEPAKMLLLFAATFIAFIGIVNLKNWILKDGIVTKPEKVAFYGYATFFIPLDVYFNVTVGNVLFWQAANAHGEGWTFTSRINWHVEQVTLYGRPRTLRIKMAIAFCGLLHAVEKFHCRAMRGLK